MTNASPGTARQFDLTGDVALVTGAGSGIGRAIAIGLADAGASVACVGHLSRGGLQHTVRQIEALGGRAAAVECSVEKEGDVARAVAETESLLGELTIAVNNAGVANAGPAEEMPLQQWQELYKVNVEGVFLSCKAEAAVMLPRGRGSIINVASMSGSIVNRGLNQAHYNSSKAAVIHMTKSLAMEWADRGVRVNVISPGYTLTPMNKRPEVTDQLKAFAADTPMQRVAEPEEMAGPAIFLASRASSFITGHDLIVDGGFVCW
jgi:NAD(P)-dependent dehydrogenase (short-subunit alcohol dehydrogenase family)